LYGNSQNFKILCIFKTFSHANVDETKEKPNLWKKAFCQIGVKAGELNDSFFRDP
jgi:hypothetical protein